MNKINGNTLYLQTKEDNNGRKPRLTTKYHRPRLQHEEIYPSLHGKYLQTKVFNFDDLKDAACFH